MATKYYSDGCEVSKHTQEQISLAIDCMAVHLSKAQASFDQLNQLISGIREVRGAQGLYDGQLDAFVVIGMHCLSSFRCAQHRMAATLIAVDCDEHENSTEVSEAESACENND